MMKNFYLILLILIVGLIIGFFVGRSNRITKTVIRYENGQTIHDTVKVPQPYLVEVPKTVYLPTKPIILKGDTILVTDTIEIIKDYSNIKHYDFNLFNSKEIGKLDLKQSVQYNALIKTEYDFTPVTKVVTITQKEKYIPFIGGGYSTNNYVNVGAGIFINDIGLEYLYNFNSQKYESKTNFHTFNLKMKF